MLKQLKEPFQHASYLIASEHLDKEASPEQNKRVQNWTYTLKRLWTYLFANRLKLVLVLSMVICSSIFAILGPFLVGTAVDYYIVAEEFGSLPLFLIGLGAVYLFHSLSVFGQNFWMVEVAQRTVYRIRTELFDKLHTLRIPFFDHKKHGELMSRLTNDIENISNTLNSSVVQIFSSILMLLGTVSVMLWLSPLLTLFTLTIVPAMFYGMKWITKRTRPLFMAQQKNIGNLNAYIEETLSGQEIVKTYSQEDRVIEAFEVKNARLRHSGFWAQTFSGFIPKLMNTLNNFSFAIIAGIGGIFALNGMISIGVIVIFTEYARQFTRPLNDLANQFNTILSALAGAERVFAIMDEKQEGDEDGGKRELTLNKGAISFSEVSFSYDGKELVLENVSFQAEPGETIAFVGPTGAGKTTIIQLLSRFYEINSGDIVIDKESVKEVTRDSVRQSMAFVMQDSFLFEGTIRENIRYGRLNATDEEVEEAARYANADPFIRRFPNQYDTVLDSEGKGISQGERQLLAIARALLADPPILVLDEATSSIDTITEIKIQEALEYLMKDRTSIVIAHRLNTIKKADQIIVVNKGKVYEKGTHEELLKQYGMYYELYQSQLQEVVG
ncbi:ABC transporter ATP-binding protein [Salsuginibacillus kocurii]|uniref:ABC transporter ATP-binding protein n=1 Tax=Salsuginibacillus kocurii TaxID=427078 RepID=UPI000362C60C|nr:ABC transporter ATP-binding protein [Salsuginibacillus kocurii]